MRFNIPVLIGALLIISNIAGAQVLQNEKPHIQVTAATEKEVVPDEIYISITLVERFEGRNKVTIEEQEKQLKEKIKSLGIDLTNLSVSDADASYIRVNWFDKDVMARKNFILKVANAETISRVFQQLGEMNIKNADVARVDYSKKEELRKQLRIEAVKKAKSQAEYMLEAIGQTAGKPLYIAEHANYFPMDMRANKAMMNEAQVAGGAAAGDANYLEFKKIKFTSTVEAKFEIK